MNQDNERFDRGGGNAKRLIGFPIGIAPSIYALSVGVEKFLDGTVKDLQCQYLLGATVVCSLIAGFAFASNSEKPRSLSETGVRTFIIGLGFVALNGSIAFVGCTVQVMSKLH